MKRKLLVFTVFSSGLLAIITGLFLVTPTRLLYLTNDGNVSENGRYFLWLLRIIIIHGGVLAVLTAGLISIRRQASKSVSSEPQGSSLDLFVVSFLILFMELAFIRWIPAYPKLMAYFTNFILLACFLGIGLGCLAIKSRVNYLRTVPFLLVVTTLVTLLIFTLYNLNLFAYSLSNYSKDEVIYFGGWGMIARFRNVGISLIIGIIFISVTLTFIGPGQLMGRLFERFENPVSAYSVNIGASIAGIIALSIFSFLSVPAWVWFLCIFFILSWLLWRDRTPLKWLQICIILISISAMIFANISSSIGATFWSPYYKVFYSYPTIVVNGIGHQKMESADKDKFNFNYNIAYLLARDTSGHKFDDILVIGAGSGNDVSHALKHGAKHVDAVEIDPVIMKLGKKDHPDRPYDDPRVTVINDDGRSYLHGTEKKYDMIVYAFVDSLTLMSNFTSVRLESFLFTEEAFNDVRRHLKPDGIFVMYNGFRENWLIHRLFKMVKKSFGDEPLLMVYPPIKTISEESDSTGVSVFIAGENGAMKKAFESYGQYYMLKDEFDHNYNFNGFKPPSDRDLKAIYSTSFSKFPEPNIPNDNWPFVYLKNRSIPSHNVIGLFLVAIVSLLFVSGFMGVGGLPKISLHYFFLGGAFMLIETESIVKLALIHGSTWFVNSVVFVSVLSMIFLANMFILRNPIRSSIPVYMLLFISLAINYLVPLEAFLGKGWLIESGLSSLMLFIPIAFAGIIFANSFRRSTRPALDLGSNLLGIIFGGIAEYASLVFGYNALLIFAIGMYFISMISMPKNTTTK